MTEAPILVTGAAGFVGGHLLDLLSRQSTPIVAWHRPDDAPGIARTDVRWMSVDLRDRASVTRAIGDVRPSAIYHLAGAAHIAQSWQQTYGTYEGNVRASHHLFCALRAIESRPRILIAGSAAIYQPQDRPIREDDPIRPTSPYATSKLAQEMLGQRVWEDEGVPALLARSFNHVGPRQDPSYVAAGIARQVALIEAGRQPPVLTVGSLTPTRDLADVRDTVRAYVAMMQSARPGERYNVCSGRGLSIAALIDTFTSRAHRPIEIVQDPSRMRPSDPPILVGDHARLTADTGWVPEIPFTKTVDDLLDYWRARIS